MNQFDKLTEWERGIAWEYYQEAIKVADVERAILEIDSTARKFMHGADIIVFQTSKMAGAPQWSFYSKKYHTPMTSRYYGTPEKAFIGGLAVQNEGLKTRADRYCFRILNID